MAQDQLVSVCSGINKRLKDMGDGSYAEVVYVGGGATGGGGSVGSDAITITQTVVSIPANVSTQLVSANTKRKYLAIQVIGTSGINLNIGADAVLNSGWAIAPAASVGGQGGAHTWDSGVVTQQQFKAISASATTVVVWEGI